MQIVNKFQLFSYYDTNLHPQKTKYFISNVNEKPHAKRVNAVVVFNIINSFG